MVGVAIVGIVFTSLLSGFSAGFAMIQWSREDGRATQILLEKLEQVRLFNWDQITTNGLPATFTALYDPMSQSTNPGEGLIYTGTVTVAAAPLTESYSSDLRLITITLDWESNRTPRHREISTLSAKNGLSQYRY